MVGLGAVSRYRITGALIQTWSWGGAAMSQDSSEGSKDGRGGRNTAALIGGGAAIVAAVAGAATGGFFLLAARGGTAAPAASNPTHSVSSNAPSAKPRPTATSPVASIDLTRLSSVPE